MDRPQRKNVRLQCFDYNTPGYYFITICTEEKRKLLCDIVGTGILDGPQTRFTQYGIVAREQLEFMCDFYDDVKIDKYVVMPNHVHMLVRITGTGLENTNRDQRNNRISRFVGTFKRFCNRRYGKNIWQPRSHDHVVRGEKDYQEIWTYIDNNPAKWVEDKFYVE